MTVYDLFESGVSFINMFSCHFIDGLAYSMKKMMAHKALVSIRFTIIYYYGWMGDWSFNI